MLDKATQRGKGQKEIKAASLVFFLKKGFIQLHVVSKNILLFLCILGYLPKRQSRSHNL